MVVLDTSALIYWTLDPDRLTAGARAAVDEADRIVISSISIWEIGIKVRYQHLYLPLTIETNANRLQLTEKAAIRPVDVSTWIENPALDWEHTDLADRTIVATARLLGCGLVTSDKRIASFYPETIWKPRSLLKRSNFIPNLFQIEAVPSLLISSRARGP